MRLTIYIFEMGRRTFFYLCMLVCMHNSLNSQTVLYNEDFESYAPFILSGGSSGWRSLTTTNSVNRWEVVAASSCSISGTKCLMITNAGTACTYSKTDDCEKMAYMVSSISTIGYSCIGVKYTSKVMGENNAGVKDFMELMYSTNGGVSFSVLGIATLG